MQPRTSSPVMRWPALVTRRTPWWTVSRVPAGTPVVAADGKFEGGGTATRGGVLLPLLPEPAPPSSLVVAAEVVGGTVAEVDRPAVPPVLDVAVGDAGTERVVDGAGAVGCVVGAAVVGRSAAARPFNPVAVSGGPPAWWAATMIPATPTATAAPTAVASRRWVLSRRTFTDPLSLLRPAMYNGAGQARVAEKRRPRPVRLPTINWTAGWCGERLCNGSSSSYDAAGGFGRSSRLATRCGRWPRRGGLGAGRTPRWLG